MGDEMQVQFLPPLNSAPFYLVEKWESNYELNLN